MLACECRPRLGGELGGVGRREAARDFDGHQKASKAMQIEAAAGCHHPNAASCGDVGQGASAGEGGNGGDPAPG